MTVGIVAELNPFHKGHEKLIQKVKECDNCCCLKWQFSTKRNTIFTREMDEDRNYSSSWS